jgi:uncharacterized protein
MSYKPPLFLFNGHLETIYPAVFRKVAFRQHSPERINTPDDDFLDLYWYTQGAEKAVILLHGLEGNALRPYITGMGKAFFEQGYDVIAWNFRGCGTEMNRQLRFYHSGATDDLHTVIEHVSKKGYHEINLVGFSLGGNVTLKYAGEQRVLPAPVKRAIAFSVPMDLHTSCEKISEPANRIYANRFLKSLKEKIIRKASSRKEIDVNGIEAINTLIAFDDRYTAPLHGYDNARHYYQQCSSVHFVEHIKIPTLIVNAKNDPFLSPGCYPHELLKNHPFVQFESPQKGGHVGFAQFSKSGLYWSEERAVRFLRDGNA